MNVGSDARRDRLWVYAVLPVIILNIAGCILFGAYYGLASQQPELVAGIGEGQVFFARYLFIALVTWVLAASVLLKLRRAGVPVLRLIAPHGAPWRFKWGPAILVVVAFNALFAVYVAVSKWLLGGWPAFEDWTVWQRIFMVGFVTVTTGF